MATALKKEISKDYKGIMYRTGILEAILYHSTKNGNATLPTIEALIHREIVDAAVEYITGKKSTYQPPGRMLQWGTKPNGEPNYRWHHDLNLEKQMWNYFQENLRKSKNKVNPKIEKALIKILEPYYGRDETGDGEYDSELNFLFKRLGICDVIMRSTFSLPLNTINHVKKDILPNLSESERKNVSTIGKLMKKYVKRDLAYIKETYMW